MKNIVAFSIIIFFTLALIRPVFIIENLYDDKEINLNDFELMLNFQGSAVKSTDYLIAKSIYGAPYTMLIRVVKPSNSNKNIISISIEYNNNLSSKESIHRFNLIKKWENDERSLFVHDEFNPQVNDLTFKIIVNICDFGKCETISVMESIKKRKSSRIISATFAALMGI